MKHLIPFYQARLPIAIKDYRNGSYELEQLQHLIQGVAARFKNELIKKGLDYDVFHNHFEKGTTSKQPRILYQISNRTSLDSDRIKYATLTGFAEGASALKWLLHNFPNDVLWNGQREMFRPIDTIEKEAPLVEGGNVYREYAVYEWLALSGNKGNKDMSNYEKYKSALDMGGRKELLQSILIANLKNLFERWGINTEDRPSCYITEITKVTHDEVKYKQRDWYSFNLTFACNWLLPDSIGIGNGIALGFGKIRLLETSVVATEPRYERMQRIAQLPK